MVTVRPDQAHFRVKYTLLSPCGQERGRAVVRMPVQMEERENKLDALRRIFFNSLMSVAVECGHVTCRKPLDALKLQCAKCKMEERRLTHHLLCPFARRGLLFEAKCERALHIHCILFRA